MKIKNTLLILMLAAVLGLSGCEEEATENEVEVEEAAGAAKNETQENKGTEKDEEMEHPQEIVDEVEEVDEEKMIDFLVGTWGNDTSFSDDEVMKFSMAYYTEFHPDHTIFQRGYRNSDSGTYEIIDENIIVATFDHNCYEDPADPDNVDPIPDYAYTITYTINEDGTMYATHSENFHQCIMSNDLDGLIWKFH